MGLVKYERTTLDNGVIRITAVSGGEVIGSAFSKIDGKTADVFEIQVNIPFRGRKIGTSLSRILDEELMSKGVEEITGELPRTFDRENLAKFHSSMGATIEGDLMHRKL